jgi:hypothetical protein
MSKTARRSRLTTRSRLSETPEEQATLQQLVDHRSPYLYIIHGINQDILLPVNIHRAQPHSHQARLDEVLF